MAQPDKFDGVGAVMKIIRQGNFALRHQTLRSGLIAVDKEIVIPVLTRIIPETGSCKDRFLLKIDEFVISHIIIV
jgi:hypothetical protein